jgi:hypothetical protein
MFSLPGFPEKRPLLSSAFFYTATAAPELKTILTDFPKSVNARPAASLTLMRGDR